jgi:quercetin dioxygenase-like cupin family protein
MADLTRDLMARLRQEAKGCYSWSNRPGDVYPDHDHAYEKVLYCVAGSITFTLEDREIRLGPGDRMVLAPGTIHGAVVGDDGCTCIEGRGGNMAAR